MSEARDYVGHADFASRSSLTYFHSHAGWRRHWRWLVGVPVAACFVWLLSAAALGQWRIYQAGPVSSKHSLSDSSHADFENDCSQCHTAPLRTLARFVYPPARATPDSACMKCHETSGRDQLAPPAKYEFTDRQGTPAPPHAPGQATDPPCATCHHEHRGKPLAQVADGHCTACHAELGRDEGRAVSGFVGLRHAEIRWPADTGTIRFSHKRHCDESVMGRGKEAFTMECGDCHTPTKDGRHFEPIRYARHCADCHPHRVGLVDHLSLTGAARDAADTFGRQPLAHGEPPASVRAALARRLGDLLRTEPALWKTGRPDEIARPLPAGRVPRRPLPAAPSVAAWLERQQNAIESDLFGRADGCRHCHKERSPFRETALPVYHRSSIPAPAVLRRSVAFDHARHRIVEGKEIDCRTCHDASAATSETVMLPSITACQKCHKPAGEPRGAVAGSCVTCHRYHDWRKEHASHRGPATPAP